jgi:organic radical activating enzyme
MLIEVRQAIFHCALRSPCYTGKNSMIWSKYRFDQIPFSDIVRVGQMSLLQRDLFCVSWLLGRFCNYKCSYCWPYARSDKKDHRPTELVISTLDEIKRQARERGFNSFHFSFSGGEPTMHPGYLAVLHHYAQDADNCNYQSVHMTSNLSPGLAWFQKYVDATARLHRVSITASYHKEFAQRDKFLEKLIFLQKNNVQATINMVMVPERFEVLWEDALLFADAGVNVTLKPQSNSSATKVVDGYSDDQLHRLQQGMPQRDYTRHRVENEATPRVIRPKAKWGPAPVFMTADGEPVPPIFQVEMTDSQGKAWYMDQAERFNAFEFNNFKGWECSAGYRSIIIREPDGVIKRSYSCSDAPLGHIEKGFSLFDGPRLCQTGSCVSSADSKIPKRKCGSRLPLWPHEKINRCGYFHQHTFSCSQLFSHR